MTNGMREDDTMCASPGCTEIAAGRLACPKCLQLGIPPSYFCSQNCFKDNYSSHKQVHSMAKLIIAARSAKYDDNLATIGTICSPDAPPAQKLQLPLWARTYRFSGKLRPALFSPQRNVPDHIPKPDYADHPDGVSECEERERFSSTTIPIYGSAELDDEYGLHHVSDMGREVLDIASRALRPGVSGDEIDRIVHDACVERECYPSPLNYYNFPKSVCVSVNEVICHGIPDYREIEDGDIVNLDVSVYNRGGYHSDLNETYCVGNVDPEGRRLVQVAFECLQLASEMIKPGTLYRELGNAIEKYARSQRCSVVRTFCGHGIGTLFHTKHTIPHYAKNKAKGTMKPGHVFTIEPMINLGVHGDRMWDDNWTVVTTDGQRSAQFEHTFLVTDSGYEILTARPDEPVMVWDASKIDRP